MNHTGWEISRPDLRCVVVSAISLVVSRPFSKLANAIGSSLQPGAAIQEYGLNQRSVRSRTAPLRRAAARSVAPPGAALVSRRRVPLDATAGRGSRRGSVRPGAPIAVRPG